MSLGLFDDYWDEGENLLPFDGIVNDFGQVLSKSEADNYFSYLLTETPWRQDEAIINGQHIITARQVAWVGDSNFHYHYSGITREATPWNAHLLELKRHIEERIKAISPTHFNSCLLNLYANGNEGVSWHSDNEKSLGQQTVIASLSLGSTRKFCFKHKVKNVKCEMLLKHGQLIVMRGNTQAHWLHAVMKASHIHEPRINLTFRTFVG